MATERQRLIHSLFEEYVEMYTSRDDRLTSRFSDNFSGYAGSSDQLITDKEEWIRITRRDFSQVPGRIRFEMLDLALQDLAKDVVVATAFFHIHLPEPNSSCRGKRLASCSFSGTKSPSGKSPTVASPSLTGWPMTPKSIR